MLHYVLMGFNAYWTLDKKDILFYYVLFLFSVASCFIMGIFFFFAGDILKYFLIFPHETWFDILYKLSPKETE